MKNNSVKIILAILVGLILLTGTFSGGLWLGYRYGLSDASTTGTTSSTAAATAQSSTSTSAQTSPIYSSPSGRRGILFINITLTSQWMKQR